MAQRIRLILASASPRRRHLLKSVGIPFRVIPSHVSEVTSEKNPIRLVRELALRKARHIASTLTRPVGTLSQRERAYGRVPSPFREKVAEGRMRGDRLFVLGADTVVVLAGRILGKPRDLRHAYRMLSALSGSVHHVYTGVALVDAKTQKSRVAHAKSVVRMKKIPEKDIRRLSRRHLDKAGSYAIQEKRDPIARVVKGSYDNVVGLPVNLVKQLLRRVGAGFHPRPR